MFYIDLASGEVVDFAGSKVSQPIHFTGGQKEEFIFSFVNSNTQYTLPSGNEIVIMGDVAEHYPSPMFISYGEISTDRTSAMFVINTGTEEYFQRIKASNTPCFADICIYDTVYEQYVRLIRFNAVADLKLDPESRPPEPLRKYYTSGEIDALFAARELDFSVKDTQAIMLEYGEQPYADITVVRNSNRYEMSFSIAVPAGKTGTPGPQGQPGQAGYSPQKGIDYWTAEDIADIHNYVDNAILNGEW